MKKFLFLALTLSLVLGCDKNEKYGTFTGFDFTKEGYINGDNVWTLERDGITLTFGRPATWFNDGKSLHVYSGTTFVLSSDKTIERITFTFAEEESSASIMAFEGELAENVWKGADNKVFFKIEGTSGYRCISRMEVKLGSKASDNMTDVIDASFTGVSGSNYAKWSGKKGSASPATYLGETAVYSGSSIEFSRHENCGIASHASGGNVRHIQIVWGNDTQVDREVQVYGDNLAYSASSDLYNSSYAGTLLGTFVCGRSNSTIIDVPGNYKYVGLRPKLDDNTSNQYKLYIDKIEVTWE